MLSVFMDDYIFYITAGMFTTWFIQMRSSRFIRKTTVERMQDSFVCSLFTASISAPLLDHFSQLPCSITLLIGAIVGTIGYSGWEKFAHSIMDLLFNFLGSNEKLPQKKTTVTFVRKKQAEHLEEEDDDDEPPIIIKRKKDKNASK